MDASSPLWWQRFETERADRRLQHATRVLRGEPARDTYGEQMAGIAHDLLTLAALPSGELTARDWRVVQECATRLLLLARVAEVAAVR